MSTRLSICLLGIDGAGKSTITNSLKKYLENKGYSVNIVGFHKWLLADKARNLFWKSIDQGRPTLSVPYQPKRFTISAIIKPVIALIDNIFFYVNNFPDGKSTNIVIFDRFICATQIKFSALGYHVNWTRFIWDNISPDIGFLIDIPVDISIQRQQNREDPYIYSDRILTAERNEYFKYANKHDFLIINGMNSIQSNIEEIFENITKILDN